MKEIVLITGANGHLAKFVSEYLKKDYEIRFLTTNKKLKKNHYYWDINSKYLDINSLKNCKHIIHLAGYSILKKWTKKNKSIMYNSRIKSTNLLFEKCQEISLKPKTFICASAMGIYKQNNQEITYENSEKGSDWVSKMACDWEKSSNKFKEINSRVIQLRISLIFSKAAGFLKYNLMSMKYGLGLIIGDPNKNINWIDVNDVSRFIKKCLTNHHYIGPYNLSCDENISQKKMIYLIKKKLYPYCIILKIPNFLIAPILGGRKKIINFDLKLSNEKLKKDGFKCSTNSFATLLDKLN